MELVITSKTNKSDSQRGIGSFLFDVIEQHPGAKLVSHECYSDGETAVFNL